MRYFVTISALLALVATLVAVKVSQIGLIMNSAQAAKQSGPPPETVSTATATKVTWGSTLTAVGSVEAGKGVTLSNDAPGKVTRLAFESGDEVRAGQILVELDTSVERAQLRAATARLEFARTTLNRTRALVEGSVAAAEDLDTAQVALQTGSAEVAALEAQIAKKSVLAPFSGQLGIRRVNVGQYLSPGSPVTTLQSTKDDYVDFALSQQYLEVLRQGLPVQVRDKDAGIQIEGEVAAIAPAVDQATRSVTVRAAVRDVEKRLRPGMFLNVTVQLDAKREVVMVPTTALVYAPYGDSLFLLEGDSKSAKGQIAVQQFVRLGESRGDFVEIDKGLSGGETIVSAGAFKLRNGSRVVVDNTSVPQTPKLSPQPPNR